MFLFNLLLGVALIILGAISILVWMYLFYLLINKGVKLVLAHKGK
tara:strand:- start:108 stop:242 length:135 start_codon:yes stop_codon:yes gene_type:complete